MSEPVRAKDVKIGHSFQRLDEIYKGLVFTRLMFEEKETIVYRCNSNIVAISGLLTVWCIPALEIVVLV
jgi:hypothetical protein